LDSKEHLGVQPPLPCFLDCLNPLWDESKSLARPLVGPAGLLTKAFTGIGTFVPALAVNMTRDVIYNSAIQDIPVLKKSCLFFKSFIFQVNKNTF
jgi:hypothetical protein